MIIIEKILRTFSFSRKSQGLVWFAFLVWGLIRLQQSSQNVSEHPKKSQNILKHLETSQNVTTQGA
jgi:hypothetical protein